MRFDRVIWDFNGTILDDLSVSIDSANQLLENHGLPKIENVEHYHRVFGFPIIEYYKRLGFDFEKIPYSVLANEWVGIYLEKVKKAPAREGIKEAVRCISELDIRQTVLSMTESDMLRHQLELISMDRCFDEVYGLTDIYAKSKLALAAEWRNNHPNERVLYVGDTTHDAESAKVIGAELYLLEGGHESRETLLRSGVPVISSPKEILDIITNS